MIYITYAGNFFLNQLLLEANTIHFERVGFWLPLTFALAFGIFSLIVSSLRRNEPAIEEDGGVLEREDTEENKIKVDELLFDIIKKRYESEMDRMKSIDAKGGNLIG
jgi:hypothetical protein